jgi:hypothetical protein
MFTFVVKKFLPLLLILLGSRKAREKESREDVDKSNVGLVSCIH